MTKTKDKQLKVRLTQEDHEKLKAAAYLSDAESKSELVRNWIRNKLNAPRNLRIDSLERELEEIEETKVDKRKKLEKLKQKQKEIEEQYRELKPEIKEYLLPIFKEAERKNESLKYRKEGLIEKDLKERFGIEWDNESRALELLRDCDPLTYEEIEPEIDIFLENLMKQDVIRDIEGVGD
ncbi:MAG: hypothetical protein ACOC55_01935 [Candidatus Natronoplasma sp.]